MMYKNAMRNSLAHTYKQTHARAPVTAHVLGCFSQVPRPKVDREALLRITSGC